MVIKTTTANVTISLKLNMVSISFLIAASAGTCAAHIRTIFGGIPFCMFNLTDDKPQINWYNGRKAVVFSVHKSETAFLKRF